jgi:hypothetical protein
MIHYNHSFITGYTADLDSSTGLIVFYKVTPDTGKTLFSLTCRSWKDLETQTKTLARDWVISKGTTNET